MAQPDLILHHYDTSPFSEKVRLLFGLKGLSWNSVIQPTIMPKPDLTPLTGGYRRIPVLQVGADVYCDSQVILAEVAARAGGAPLEGAGWAVNLWADRLFFGATVPIIFGEIEVPKAFIEDREKLSGRPFDSAQMKAAAGPMKQQWRAQAAWLDQALAHSDYLAGDKPGLAQTAKLVNNLLAAAALVISSEGMAMGVKAGLDPKILLDIINVSSGRNSATQDKFPRSVLPGTFDFGFATALSYKDVRLCLDEAEAMGVPMIMGAVVRQILALTQAKYGPDSDFTSIAKLSEEWAGVQIRG